MSNDSETAPSPEGGDTMALLHKAKSGERLTRCELSALRRFQREGRDRFGRNYCAAVPFRHLRELCGLDVGNLRDRLARLNIDVRAHNDVGAILRALLKAGPAPSADPAAEREIRLRCFEAVAANCGAAAPDTWIALAHQASEFVLSGELPEAAAPSRSSS